MPRPAPRNGYDAPTRALHWVMAVGIAAALALGLVMVRQPAATEAEVATVFRLYSLHKTLGMALLGLALLRLAWRLFHAAPGPLHPERRLEAFLARLVHATLWGAMVLLPVTGWLHHAAAPGFAPILWPLGQSLPGVPADERLALVFRTTHAFSGWLLLGALALHVAGTLRHALLDRDATLARMLTGKGPQTPPPRPARHIALVALALWSVALLAALLAAPAPEPDPFDALPDLAIPFDATAPTD
jgi:cytochrome b561